MLALFEPFGEEKNGAEHFSLCYWFLVEEGAKKEDMKTDGDMFHMAFGRYEHYVHECSHVLFSPGLDHTTCLVHFLENIDWQKFSFLRMRRL